jgi:CSLREA domain-containing protein
MCCINREKKVFMFGKTRGHCMQTYGSLCALKIVCLLLAAGFVAGSLCPLAVTMPAAAAEPSQENPPSQLIVTKLADTNDGICDGDCSLREALAVAPPDATIIFAAGLAGKITLHITLIITKNVTINGPTTKAITISGNNAVRVFSVNPDVSFTIRNLTVANGSVQGKSGKDGGELLQSYGKASAGGGLFNDKGKVTIVNSTFSANKATGGASGVVPHRLSRGGNALGGALYSTGTAVLINSTFSDNSAVGGLGNDGLSCGAPQGELVGGSGMGGALYVTGATFIVNSTFSNNRVEGGHWGRSLDGCVREDVPSSTPITIFPKPGTMSMGGAIFSSFDIRISNCTLAGNGVLPGLPHNVRAHAGGAIYYTEKFTIKNSLVTGNYSGSRSFKDSSITNRSSDNCAGLNPNSEGYNIDSDGTCGLKAIGDRSNINRKLGQLKKNGGTTFTHALKSGNPAIDSGNPAGCTDHDGAAILTDQRGHNRPSSARCDIGAFEFSR